jgi:hypothetical protein
VTLAGPDGLDLIDSFFLDRKGREVPFTETYAAVMALRFLGEESEVVPRDRVLQSLRKLLDEPKLADLVIADLARWQDWSVVDRLATLFETATADNIFVREPIVNYMKSCPLPEAAGVLEKLERIDPEAVRRAATMAGLAAITAATPAPGDPGDPSAAGGQPTAAVATDASDRDLARRIAPVLGDEDGNAGTSAVVPAGKSGAAGSGSSLKWAFWAGVVVLVGIISRTMLRSTAAH